MKESSPSLRIVAEEAGVSRMTVSLALRNHPSLPEATRQRIMKVAGRLGYRPDPDIGELMRKIREKKASRLPNVIGYITADDDRNTGKDVQTWHDYFEGAKKRAEACGYRLDEFWLNEPHMTEKRLSQIIHVRGIEGVLIAPLPLAKKIFQEVGWKHLSAVELGYSQLAPALHRACNHQFQSMLCLMQHLQSAGYNRIGLAMYDDQDERANHNWRAGYLSAESLLPNRDQIPMLLTDSWTRHSFRRWLEKYRPDVVVTIGEEVSHWLNELGCRVPQEIGLANVDLTASMKNVPGIHQNSMAVGAAAVDLLISLMSHHERDIPTTPKILMVEGTFIQGKTTRKSRIPLAKKSPSSKKAGPDQ